VVCPLLVRVASVFMTIGPSPYQSYYSKEAFVVQPRMSARRGGAAVPMHDTWGLKAGVLAERSYRAPLMEQDRDRKYASGPPSISVALFRHT